MAMESDCDEASIVSDAVAAAELIVFAELEVAVSTTVDDDTAPVYSSVDEDEAIESESAMTESILSAALLLVLVAASAD